mmetsp:Transcript_122864/g.281777  ORF Transcript_122864/g.281777 Transcript_122864/m.281777 type:complete len:375 (-) Transcript_122864:10-1134(-)
MGSGEVLGLVRILVRGRLGCWRRRGGAGLGRVHFGVVRLPLLRVGPGEVPRLVDVLVRAQGGRGRGGRGRGGRGILAHGVELGVVLPPLVRVWPCQIRRLVRVLVATLRRGGLGRRGGLRRGCRRLRVQFGVVLPPFVRVGTGQVRRLVGVLVRGERSGRRRGAGCGLLRGLLGVQLGVVLPPLRRVGPVQIRLALRVCCCGTALLFGDDPRPQLFHLRPQLLRPRHGPFALQLRRLGAWDSHLLLQLADCAHDVIIGGLGLARVALLDHLVEHALWQSLQSLNDATIQRAAAQIRLQLGRNGLQELLLVFSHRLHTLLDGSLTPLKLCKRPGLRHPVKNPFVACTLLRGFVRHGPAHAGPTRRRAANAAGHQP